MSFMLLGGGHLVAQSFPCLCAKFVWIFLVIRISSRRVEIVTLWPPTPAKML